MLTGAALFSTAAVLLTAMWATADQPVGDRTVGEVTRVGVADGDSVPGYVRSGRGRPGRALPTAASATGAGTYALVSLDAYLPPQQLAEVLERRTGLGCLRAGAAARPADRDRPDPGAARPGRRGRRDGGGRRPARTREAADYRARAAALTGAGADERELRQVYASGAEVAAAEAAAYRTGCACVYAAVVRATPAVLRGVATRPDVRAVDPAPEVYRLDRTVFTPPLPEQRDVVRPPADTGLSIEPTPDRPVETTPAPETPTPTVGESSEPAPVVTIPSLAPSAPEPVASATPTAATSPDTIGPAPVAPAPS